MNTKDTIDPEELGNAIGSTEPTVEDKAHWTPEMWEAWKRDQANDSAQQVTGNAGAIAPHLLPPEPASASAGGQSDH